MSAAGSTAASVVSTASMVAMLGMIMPEPLDMPPILHSMPSASKRTAHSLDTVSVVMMACAASAAACGLESSAPSSKGSPLR